MRASRLALKPRTHPGTGVALVIAAAAVLLVLLFVISPPAAAKRGDRIPPTFAGLKSATTCIPGAIGGGRTTSYHLSWDPASANVPPSSKIVYDVYHAGTPGGRNFPTPSYPTAAGAA